MKRGIYGALADGRQVEWFELENENGLAVRCINYGCRLTDILVPEAGSGKANVVLGFDDLAGYQKDGSFQGAFVGRYANRIAGAAFTIAGVEHRVLQNEGQNYLHGTMHQQLFAAEVIGDNSVSFTYTSPDGEDGFPGEVWVAVSYTLTGQNELMMDYRAVPRAATHLNFTNHSYFNLAGRGDVLGHQLTLNADRFLEGGEGLLPTGRVLEVFGGAFDFLQEKPLGRDIEKDDPQLKLAGGYDHCYIINKEQPGMALAAVLREPQSGRSMRVFTSQPGVQLYTANFLGPVAGREGATLGKNSGVCLETQHFPDSPHHNEFPPTLYRAGEKYRQSTVLQFGW